MKQLFLFILLSVTISFPAIAQRNLPGQLGIEMIGGAVDGFLLRNKYNEKSCFGTLSLTRFNRNSTYWNFGVGYLQKDYTYDQQRIPKAQFTAEVGYHIPLLSDRRNNVVFSVGFCALGGYETSN